VRKCKILIILSLMCLFLLNCPFSAAETKDKKWHDIITSVDESGNTVTSSVFGYFVLNGGALVACDPATGEETGKAYVPGVKIGDKSVKITVGYEKKEGEDWSQVKRIDPVNVRLLAPNIVNNLSYSDYSIEQYYETGNLYDTASGPVTWPGPTQGFLVPGDDPDYWLIVAEVSNPNPWPVKINLAVKLGQWQKYLSSRSGATSIDMSQEVSLGANETKYALINRGSNKDKGYLYLAYDSDWNGYKRYWSRATQFRTFVTENLDPELPAELGPNKGFISFSDYGGLTSVPDDLSGGINFMYSVRCEDYKRKWYFKGKVNYTENGWVAVPGDDSENPDLAKQKVEAFFNSRSFDQLPYINDSLETIDNIKFYGCAPSKVSLNEGPDQRVSQASGPALADYTSIDDGEDLGWGDGQYKTVNNEGRQIPVLTSRPIFYEFYRFKPTDSANVGVLTKEYIPGFLIENSSINRPYITIDDTYQSYNVVSADSNWKISINHHVKITASNPDDSVAVGFTKAYLALTNVFNAVNCLSSNLYYITDETPVINSPNYKSVNYSPTFLYFDDISLSPCQSVLLYDSDVTTEILVKAKGIRLSDLEYAITGNIRDREKVLSFFTWSGDAAFVQSGNSYISLSPMSTTEQVLSFNTGQIRYRKNGDYYYKDVSVIDRDCNPWISTVSYFSDGLSVRPLDGAYTSVLSAKKLKARVYEGDNFWPIMQYGSSRWTVKKWPDY